MLTNASEEAFEARGLDIEVAARMGARFDRGAFRFDYTRDGSFLYAKVRTPDKQFRIEPSGRRMQFWNLDALRGFEGRRREQGEFLVVTEGEFDAIAVAQACGGYVVSVPNGVAGKRSEGDIIIAEDNRFSYIWEGEQLIQELDQFDKIVLCVDGDDPGMILRDELALRIGETRCWYVTYPGGCKDANDVLRTYGADALRKLIGEARPMRPGFLVKPSDVPPRSLSQNFSTGFGWTQDRREGVLDPHLMLERPELMVVTGEPGHGKGQFIRCMTFHLAEKHGWRTAYLTPEDPAHRVKRDMMRFAKRAYFEALMGDQPHWNSTREQDRQAEEWVDACFRISMPPEDEPITIEMVEREMEAAALHHNCQVFVLDPWNEVEHVMNRGELETQYVERTLRRLLRKMRRLNLVLIIAAHPTKIGDGEKVSLYKISGSSNWKNKCQHGVIVRKLTDNVAEIEVEKSKDWERMGQPGKIGMRFDRWRCDYRYVELPKDEDVVDIRGAKKRS